MALCRLPAFGLLLAAIASPAWADSIDGNWCHPDGRRMAIHGPAIDTPGGGHIQGDYVRHAFTYVVPPAESGSGDTVRMALLNEDNVQVTDRDGAAPQVWKRCGPPTS